MKLVTIKIQTVLGENEDFDALFFQYLDEYSIEYKILPTEEDEKYPMVEYNSGPIALNNMLRERFGYDRYEIEEKYPELIE
jgi:hypothetical protein